MSYGYEKAIEEFDILEKTVDDPVILPFKEEILALVKRFSESGQSGGSAPYTAKALSQAVEHLCLQEPMCPITCSDDEWIDRSEESCGDEYFQNNRLSSVFKEGEDGKPYFLDAIVFRGQSGSCFTSNCVDMSDGTKLGSAHYVRAPFKPKTFYIDVVETEWYKDPETGALTEQKGGGWWTSVVKNESQLEEVWEYYDRMIRNNEKVD